MVSWHGKCPAPFISPRCENSFQMIEFNFAINKVSFRARLELETRQSAWSKTVRYQTFILLELFIYFSHFSQKKLTHFFTFIKKKKHQKLAFTALGFATFFFLTLSYYVESKIMKWYRTTSSLFLHHTCMHIWWVVIFIISAVPWKRALNNGWKRLASTIHLGAGEETR